MKQVERLFGIALSVLFVYAMVELLFGVSGVLASSPTHVIPFRINSSILVMAILLSGIAGLVFPVWSIGKYLNTNDAERIVAYEYAYKKKYFVLCIGYIGLIFWSISGALFDWSWIFGTLLLLWIIVYLILSMFKK